MKFRENKTQICVDLFFVSFTNFKGIQGFYTKFQAMPGFKEPKQIPGFSRFSSSCENPVDVKYHKGAPCVAGDTVGIGCFDGLVNGIYYIDLLFLGHG